MDTIQEFKQRAISLEAKGDDNGALKVYSAIPSDRLDAGLLGRMAAVQTRLGKTADALKSHERAAAILLNDGLNNAAIFAYRQLLRLAPEHAEAHLRLGQMAGTAGYPKDAIAAFSDYLKHVQGEDRGSHDDLVSVLEGLPISVRSEIVGAIRDEITARDASLAGALDAMMNADAEGASSSAGSRFDSAPARQTESLRMDVVDEDEPGPPAIAPLEGLETHGDASMDLPPILGDLPLLGHSLDRPEEDEVPAAEETDSVQSFGASSDFPALGQADEELEDDGEGADLPLISFGDDSVGADHEVAFPDAEDQPAEEWVDFGALVLGESGASGESGGTAAETGDELPSLTGSHDEEFSGLLEELGAGAMENSDEGGSHYDVGLAYKEMGLLDAAISRLHLALRDGENPLATLEVLGECYLERGDEQRSRTVLRRAIGLQSASAKDLIGVHYLLGRCEEILGEREAARESYAQVVAVEPQFRDAAMRLERI